MADTLPKNAYAVLSDAQADDFVRVVEMEFSKKWKIFIKTLDPSDKIHPARYNSIGNYDTYADALSDCVQLKTALSRLFKLKEAEINEISDN